MPSYDIGPRIGIEGEKEFRNAIKAIDSQVRALTNEIKTLSKEYDANDSSLEGVTKKQNALNQAIETSRKRIELLTSQYEKQVAELKKLEDALEQARRENGEGSTEAIRAESALAKQAKTVNDLGSRLELAKGQLITFENQLRDLGNTATRAGDLLQTAGNKISSIGGAISGVGNALTVGVTTPILAAATAAVTMGNDFEAQMSRVQAIAGATGDEFQVLQEQALQLGADTSYSATEVAQGMENLASAGFTVDEIMASMSGMLDLAASSGADLATASEIAASALRGFGLDASESSHVADVFAEAAARTNAQVEDMGEAMTYIAPVANAMGQSLEETAAAVGIMSDAGIKGSQAGTALRGALSRLAKPTSAMQETMEELGISFYDTQGQMLPLSDMIETLEGSMAGLDDETRNNALVTLFGQEALPGVLALLERGSDDLRTLTASFQDADGAAAEMAETMLDNTAGSIEEMTGALETAGITVQQVLAPHIRSAAEYVTDLADQFSDLDEEQQKSIVAWAGIAAAAGPAVKILGTATSGVGKLTKGVGTVVSDLGKIAQSGGKATDSMSAFGKVLGTLGPKGLLVGVAIAGVTGIAGAVIKARDDIVQAEIDEAFGDIKLSAEEVEDVAQRLTETEWKMEITAAVDAQAQVESLKAEVENALEEINKLNWKVKIGLDLSEEEQSTYISQFEQYVQGIQDTITQQGYSSSLAIDVVFGDGDAFGESLQTFYSDYISKASSYVDRWGEYFAQHLNDSFADNTFSRDLVNFQQIIDNLNGTMQEVLGYGYDAKLAQFELEYDALLIDESSYDALVEELKKNQQEMAQYIEEITEPILIAIRARYRQIQEQGVPEEFARAVYDDSLSYVQEYINQMDVENITLSFGAAFDQLSETEFGESIRKVTEDVQEEAQAFSQSFVDAFEQGGLDLQNALYKFQEEFPRLAGGAQDKVSELVKAFQPQKEHLEALRDSYIEVGQQVPKYISDGLSDIAALEAMTGGADGMYSILGQAIADSPQLLEVLTQSQLAGRTIPEELATSIAMYAGYVYDTATGMWSKLSDDTEQASQKMAELMNQYGLEYGSEYADGIASQYGLVYKNGRWMVQKTADGVRDNTPALLMEAEKSAADTVNQFDTTISGATVGPVKMAVPDIASSINTVLDIAQSVANRRTIYYTVAARGASRSAANEISAYADGGIVNTPQIALIGEAGAEAIIPLERNRENALNMWYRAGQELNAFAAEQGRAVGAARREQIINNTTNQKMEINNAEGAFVIHTQATNGRQLYKELVLEMQRDVKRKEAAYGNS